MFEDFNQLPFQNIIKSYLYQQYADDSDLQAFVSSYNNLAQGYLDWFNQTPLSVYTNSNISGLLLDWVGAGLYNVTRPVISTSSSTTSGVYGTAPYGLYTPYGIQITTTSGTATVATDDVYKRALTWNLYAGDGYQMSIIWLRKRIARFLYGVNGSDISVDDLINVSISSTTISIPNNAISTIFKELYDSAVLPIPFEKTFTVTLV